MKKYGEMEVKLHTSTSTLCSFTLQLLYPPKKVPEPVWAQCQREKSIPLPVTLLNELFIMSMSLNYFPFLIKQLKIRVYQYYDYKTVKVTLSMCPSTLP
jgi:hypothetical protein